jgi:hypothetical protein
MNTMLYLTALLCLLVYITNNSHISNRKHINLIISYLDSKFIEPFSYLLCTTLKI